ncbi:MAG: enoyl-CoA hydratase-related protein, partial [Candidatus Acidiferrales bacterium]
MNYETLRWEMDSGVATITLARPEKRNAISGRMIEEMLGALGQAAKSAARVVILGASDKACCAGMDLDELQGLAR